MRVRVEFETTARYEEHYVTAYSVDIPTNGGHKLSMLIPKEYVTVLSVEEPTEPGTYAIEYAPGVRGVACRSYKGYWVSLGDSRECSWQELGNIVKVKRLDFDALLD